MPEKRVSFNTPILFIVFNRPLQTKLVFDAIKKLKPAYLFIAADGFREKVPHEKLYCEEVKKIISSIDWDCDVKYKYNSENLGCGKAVSSAISWFFQNVEQGIILEDDCLPDYSFFGYCEQLLNIYRDNEKIMHIGGVNFQDGQKRGDGDYYFSSIAHVWGWATWRRAWKLYEYNLQGFNAFKKQQTISEYYPNKALQNYVLENFELMLQHKIDTWDIQWTYTIYKNKGYAIVPNKNLISNIGFISNASHTFDENNKQANNQLQSISLPLTIANSTYINHQADEYYYFNVLTIPNNYGVKAFFNNCIFTLKNTVLKIIDFLLLNFYFKMKNKKSNNVLIVKPDAIGDYIIFRNAIAAIISQNKHLNFYLLANSRLKSFIDETDKALFKEVIYYEEGISKKYKAYIRFCFQIKKIKAYKVIYCVFSRREIFDDFINRSAASIKIAPKSDTANQTAESLIKTDKIYSSLINVNNNIHEFEKVKQFLEKCFNTEVDVVKLLLPSFIYHKSNLNRIIICPGSNEKYKIWSPTNFTLLIDGIKTNYPSYTVDIVYGPNEDYLANEIKSKTNKVDTIIAVTSIIELCKEVQNSTFVISNDSAPIHIAVAYNIKNICIFNGSRYGRFVPYPAAISKVSYTIIPQKLTLSLNQATENYYYHHLTRIDINEITVEEVLAVLFKNLN